MTETGIFTINTNENKRKFSVGKNYYGQIKIVSDGEILYKNKSCLKQYKNNKKATNELIDEENWIHTGDIGKLDEDGYLYITGRKKELIITSGGENVPPVLIENRIRTFIKGISNIMVVGDKRKYLSCIVTLPKIEYNNPEKLEKWNSLIKQAIDNYNSIAISRVQTIKKFKILESEFSIENGCLTPTMKLKRNFIIEKFKKEIDEMYDD
jgi:long-subunit acyl-CoA synthetase (AMP-forming)